jgi:hypothetical protein
MARSGRFDTGMNPAETAVPVPEPPSSRLYGRGAGYQARPMGAKLLTRQSGGVATPGAGIEDTTMAGGSSGPVSVRILPPKGATGTPSAAVGLAGRAPERGVLDRFLAALRGGQSQACCCPASQASASRLRCPLFREAPMPLLTSGSSRTSSRVLPGDQGTSADGLYAEGGTRTRQHPVGAALAARLRRWRAGRLTPWRDPWICGCPRAAWAVT